MLWRAALSAVCSSSTQLYRVCPAVTLCCQNQPTRTLFKLPIPLKSIFGLQPPRKAERKLGDVEWRDEYATLGDSPQETHASMVAEDKTLRASEIFLTSLRKQVFEEIVRERKRYARADEPAQMGESALYSSTTSSGAPCWVKEDEESKQVIVSAEKDDLGELFHNIVDLKLNHQQDKVAILVNDGKHPDAFTCILKPIGISSCYSGVMDASAGAHFESLESVSAMQWMLEGQHLAYTRVGAACQPTEVWLHHVGQEEADDRQLYEEEQEGFTVHVSLTTDNKYVTVTALSKTSTEVHIMDAGNPDSALQLVLERRPGLMYWVSHAFGNLVIMHNAERGTEYDISITPVPSPESPESLAGPEHWHPLVSNSGEAEAGGGVIEDLALYHSHLVVSSREDSMPVLRAAPWSAFGLRHSGSSDTAHAPALDALKTLSLGDLHKMDVPTWATSLVPGANLEFTADVHVVHASSPIHPEEEVRLSLVTGGRLPCAEPAVTQGLDHLRIERLQIPVAEAPVEADYLEMLYRLVPEDLAADAEVEDRPTLHGPTLSISLVHSPQLSGELGERPMAVVLRAYGAYGISADMGFNSDDLALLNRGVAIVTAHVRGGGEKGRTWHMAGTVHRKWASLYDYAAALNYLVERGITAPGMVALESFSAGALLAAHVMNKVPEAFAAGLYRRPFVTLLNSMTDPDLPMTAQDYGEWGDPQDAEVVKLWANLSPHKQIAPARYPPVLVTTGQNDSRVEWWGPVKYAWRLRSNQQAPEAPILLAWGLDGHLCHDPNLMALEKTFLLTHLKPETQSVAAEAA